MLKYSFVIAFIFFMTTTAVIATDNYGDPFVPWNFKVHSPETIENEPGSISTMTPSGLLLQSVRIFSRYISQVDGNRCQIYPSCAAYSYEAIKTYGFILGIVLTADRLIHETDEIDVAPLIKIRNRYWPFDPLCHNTFWWDNRETGLTNSIESVF
jgi:hypothetical protein